MIGDGVVDREGVPGLAGRLGYSARQVQRQLTAELGAGPVALARAQRAHTARTLLQTTVLPVTEIAFAAGFASVRQFNDTIRQIYARTPSGLRAESGHGMSGGTSRGMRGAARPGPAGTPAAPSLAGIPLRLAYRGVYAARAMFDLLADEAVPGVEEVIGEPGARTYRRTLRLPHGPGVVSVDEAPPSTHGPRAGWLEARIHLTDLRDLTTAVQRLRRLLDLDADPYAVDERLRADPLLAPWSRPAPACARREPPTPTSTRSASIWAAPGRRASSRRTGTGSRSRAARSPGCSPRPPRWSTTRRPAGSPPPSPTAPYGSTPVRAARRPNGRCSPCPA